MANERLRALEDVEKEIAIILHCAGMFCAWNLLQLLHVVFLTNDELYGCSSSNIVPFQRQKNPGTIVMELSKDKHNASLIDRQLSQFIASVNRVENELSSQIRYLTQVNTSRHKFISTFLFRRCEQGAFLTWLQQVGIA